MFWKIETRFQSKMISNALTQVARILGDTVAITWPPEFIPFEWLLICLSARSSDSSCRSSSRNRLALGAFRTMSFLPYVYWASTVELG